MLIRRRSDVRSWEITPESVYRSRRRFMADVGRAAVGVAGGALMAACAEGRAGPAAPEARSVGEWPGTEAQKAPAWLQQKVADAVDGPFDTDEAVAPWQAATRYNNFYEFGTGKDDPFEHAGALTTDPWSVRVDGEVARPGDYALEDILRPHTMEERIYRLRCVEAWSMVIPWVGFPLGDLLKRFEPTGNAKYVEFTTLQRPEEMRGQRSFFSTLDYPYVEGLRFDEAMHPLTLLAVGMYGETLPPQNGAPLRLVVPWKYGFKSIKSIVRIRLTEGEPRTTWNALAPQEYGFYANVNPQVDHPRWSQASERRLPGGLFDQNRIETRMFNGYAEQVAGLYAGMDLRRQY